MDGQNNKETWQPSNAVAKAGTVALNSLVWVIIDAGLGNGYTRNIWHGSKDGLIARQYVWDTNNSFVGATPSQVNEVEI